MELSVLLEIAIKASIEAGKEILSIYNSGNVEFEFKQDSSPLTKADMASHQIILRHLKMTGVPVLSEEGKDLPYKKRKHWKKLWIVDPLDGTKEFIKRNGEFTVNIALVEDQKPILGVIYAPVLKELYFAAPGIGSFKIRNTQDVFCWEKVKETAVKLPYARLPEKFTVVASKSHFSLETRKYIEQLKREKGEIEIISKGSSIKLCLVAEGKAHCYPRFGPTMEWDTAAGQAICSFAGKAVVDWETQLEMTYNRERLLNNWFIVK